MPDKSFPSSQTEALAYLYVQKKEYNNPAPHELAEDYMNAYKEINSFFSAHRERSNWMF